LLEDSCIADTVTNLLFIAAAQRVHILEPGVSTFKLRDLRDAVYAMTFDALGTRPAVKLRKCDHACSDCCSNSAIVLSCSNSSPTVTMPAATLPKHVLADSAKAHANKLPSPAATKRRKVEAGSSPSKRLKLSQNAVKTGSSQPKSQFEEEVLEKLTQDITGLRKQNSEKDQQWERPGLEDFDAGKDSLCFQQIDAEEGTLHGGKTTIKLFGVTEARDRLSEYEGALLTVKDTRLATQCSSTSQTSSIISMWRRRFRSPSLIPKASRPILKRNWHNISR